MLFYDQTTVPCRKITIKLQCWLAKGVQKQHLRTHMDGLYPDSGWLSHYLPVFFKSPALFSFLWSGGHGLLFQRLLMISSSWFNQSQPTSSHGKHRPPTTTWKVSTASAMSCASILLSALPTTVTMGCMVGWTFIYIYTQLNKAICNCTVLLLWVCVRIGHAITSNWLSWCSPWNRGIWGVLADSKQTHIIKT